MKIYNIYQANIFLKNGATATGAGLGNKYKTYVEFLENEVFKELMKRWAAHEF